jgi:CheY-like chemotaxis protein
MEAAVLSDIARSLSGFAWPLFGVYALARLMPHLEQLLQQGNFKIRFDKMVITVEEASKQSMYKIADLQDKIVSIESVVRKIAPDQKFVSIERIREIVRGKTILWVDDLPETNAIEVEKLREDGFEIHDAPTTADAMRKLGLRKYSLLITDMEREEEGVNNPDAGLELLSRVKAEGSKDDTGQDLRCLVYTTDRRRGMKERAMQLGARGVTSSTVDLYRLIYRELEVKL